MVQGASRSIDSGIKVYGEQRGVGMADYNQDGVPDIVISQNARETKRYQGMDKAGIRVVLAGPPDNPWAIGAKLAKVDKDGHQGPVRVIKAGSGYWSQHSRIQLLPAGEGNIWVRWPNGKEDQFPVTENERTLELNYE